MLRDVTHHLDDLLRVGDIENPCLCRTAGRGDFIGNGLVIDPAAVSTVALDRLGLPAAEATRLVGERSPDGAEERDGRIPFSAPARRALEDSLAIALNLGHNSIGTEHLLIAVARGEGGGAEDLAAGNLAPDAVEQAVMARLAEITGGK